MKRHLESNRGVTTPGRPKADGGRIEKMAGVVALAAAACVGEGCATTAVAHEINTDANNMAKAEIVIAGTNEKQMASAEQCMLDVENADSNALLNLVQTCPEATIGLAERDVVDIKTLIEVISQVWTKDRGRHVDILRKIIDRLIDKNRIDDALTAAKALQHIPWIGDIGEKYVEKISTKMENQRPK